jgi:hypothetical protein
MVGFNGGALAGPQASVAHIQLELKACTKRMQAAKKQREEREKEQRLLDAAIVDLEAQAAAIQAEMYVGALVLGR